MVLFLFWGNFRVQFNSFRNCRYIRNLGKQRLELSTGTWSGHALWSRGKFVSQMASSKRFLRSVFSYFLIWVSPRGTLMVSGKLACVASVSVEQRAENGVFGVLPARKWGESKKRKEGVGEGSEGNACGQTPWFCELRSLANGARDWLGWSNIIDMCRSKVLKFRVPERRFEACLQKALTFLTEFVLSRELRQYGRNPVVQCQRFGILKPDYYCRCNCDTICSCSLNFNITFLNVDLRQGRDNKPRNRKFVLVRGKTEWFRLACFVAWLRILSSRYSDISLDAFLLREFRGSGYNSEWFVIVSRVMPVFICLYTKHI